MSYGPILRTCTVRPADYSTRFCAGRNRPTSRSTTDQIRSGYHLITDRG